MHPSRSRLLLRCLLTILVCGPLLLSSARSHAETCLPSRQGYLTHFLFLGPIEQLPPDDEITDEDRAVPLFLAPPASAGTIHQGDTASPSSAFHQPRQHRRHPQLLGTWESLSGPGPHLDLQTGAASEAVGYLYAELVVLARFDGWLALGADDLVAAWIDGEPVLDPYFAGLLVDDHQWIELHLTAGRHPLLIETYNLRGRWAVEARLVDQNLPAPAGIFIDVPATDSAQEGFLHGLNVQRVFDPTADPRHVVDFIVEFTGVRPLEPNLVCFELLGPGPGQTRCHFVESLTEVQRRLGFPLPEVVDGPNTFELRLSFFSDKNPASHTLLFEWTTALPLLDAIRQAGETARWLEGGGTGTPLGRGTIESFEYEIQRLTDLAQDGCDDREYCLSEAENLDGLNHAFRNGQDPYARRTGHYYRAYRSELDGRLQPYAIFLPDSRVTATDLPLVVSLHGLSNPIMMNLRQVLGHDRDEDEDVQHAIRNFPEITPEPQAIFVAPYAYGNSTFRFMGETDVLRVIDELRSAIGFDPARVYLTGLSMGGIGAFEIGLRHADLFAAVLSLCGMADMNLYTEVRHASLYPWEQLLVDEYSAIGWAPNAANVPIQAVHGSEDSTRPHHSRVLIDRLNELGYTASLETPPLEHNVWATTYAGNGALERLDEYRNLRFPSRVTLTSADYRHGQQYWIRLDALTRVHRFAGVDARFDPHSHQRRLSVSTTGIEAFTLDLEDAPADWQQSRLDVIVDGQSICLDDCWKRLHVLQLPPEQWQITQSPPERTGLKRRGIEGPIQDAYFDPLVLVYGTSDPQQTPFLMELAEEDRSFGGRLDIALPVISDLEVDDEIIQHHHLVVYGDRDSNRILAELDGRLPVRARPDGILVGNRLIEGRDLTAIAIYPNPLNPDRYIVVKTGNSRPGIDAARFAPQFLGDFVVYDSRSRTAPAQRVFGQRPVLAGGFFNDDWSLPPEEQWLMPAAR